MLQSNAVWDQRGRAIGYSLSDPSDPSSGFGAIDVARVPDARTGQWTNISYTPTHAAARSAAFGYTYDVFGNVATRGRSGTLFASSLTETFVYDKLHRLQSAQRAGQTAVTYGYDAVGNFRYKSDYSTTGGSQDPYLYGNAARNAGGNAGPNAVRQVALSGGVTQALTYDLNGNLVSDTLGFQARYDHANLPVRLTRDGYTAEFRYGPDDQRTRQLGSVEHVYLDGYEETEMARRAP